MPILSRLIFTTSFSKAGMISLMEHSLFLHPLPAHLARDYGSVDGAQPHVIYRRSLDDVIDVNCDVEGTVPSILYFAEYLYLKQSKWWITISS